VEVSKNSDFYMIEYSNILSDTNVTTSILDEDWYYWHVRANNSVAIWGDWSFTSRFHIGEISDSTLIGSYSFNGNADDQSLYGNHGIVYGATLTEDRFGNPNSAYLFDGIDDYISIPNYNNIFSIVGPFTISAWVKPLNDGVNKVQPILWKLGNAGTTEDNYGLLYGLEFTNPSNKFKVQTEAINGDDFEAHSSDHLANSWYHVVGVNDELNLKIYINGVEEGSIPIGSITPFTGPEALRIGNFLHRGTVTVPGVFEGVIDEIQIYTTALSYNDIHTLYNETRK